MAHFQYPAAGSNAPIGVRQAIQEFQHLPIEKKRVLPLLYYVLGSGTPPYKMDPADAAYQQTPMPPQKCGNCSASYQHVKSHGIICDQIAGSIQLNGWCRLWRP